jgi:hypothetical protein
LTLNEPSKQNNTQIEAARNNRSRGVYAGRASAALAAADRTAGRFDIRKHKTLVFSNNISYAEYVQNGVGPGIRTPRDMANRTALLLERSIRDGLNTLK